MEKKTKKKIILGGLGTAAAGILGYFGWQWWKGRKNNNQQQQTEETASSGGTTQIAFSSDTNMRKFRSQNQTARA